MDERAVNSAVTEVLSDSTKLRAKIPKKTQRQIADTLLQLFSGIADDRKEVFLAHLPHHLFEDLPHEPVEAGVAFEMICRAIHVVPEVLDEVKEVLAYMMRKDALVPYRPLTLNASAAQQAHAHTEALSDRQRISVNVLRQGATTRDVLEVKFEGKTCTIASLVRHIHNQRVFDFGNVTADRLAIMDESGAVLSNNHIIDSSKTYIVALRCQPVVVLANTPEFLAVQHLSIASSAVPQIPQKRGRTAEQRPSSASAAGFTQEEQIPPSPQILSGDVAGAVSTTSISVAIPTGALRGGAHLTSEIDHHSQMLTTRQRQQQLLLNESDDHMSSFVARIVHEANEVLRRKDDGGEAFNLENQSLCQPFQVSKTYKLEEWGTTLTEARKLLKPGIEEKLATRSPCVMGVVAGTGFGKTHAMVNAAKAIQCKEGGAEPELVYVTYNLEQSLALDKSMATARIAILVRLILRCHRFSNAECGAFLSSARSLAKGLSADLLRQAVVWCLANLQAEHVIVCVDECRCIGAECVGYVASELGNVVRTAHGRFRCTVLLSSLESHCFTSIRSRMILRVTLPSPDTAVDWVAKELFDKANPQQLAMLAAVGGCHFRSLVVACELLKNQNDDLTVVQLCSNVMKGLHTTMSPHQRQLLRSCVEQCVVDAPENCAKSVEAFVADDGKCAVPPAFVWRIFNETEGFELHKHPAQMIFAIRDFADASMQLGYVGMHYDRFRALRDLPVVPYRMSVANGQATVWPGRKWFHQLRFSKDVAREENLNRNALFRVSPEVSSGEDDELGTESPRGAVIRTEVQPVQDEYYFPKDKSHPWIDRAVVAEHESTGQSCLILYQDKLNKSFPQAVNDLNSAADAFSADQRFDCILCVACVVDASADTRAQSTFRNPYLLVREPELANFFTPTFAQAIGFVKERHVLSS